jgi:hypothetical protein
MAEQRRRNNCLRTNGTVPQYGAVEAEQVFEK